MANLQIEFLFRPFTPVKYHSQLISKSLNWCKKFDYMAVEELILAAPSAYLFLTVLLSIVWYWIHLGKSKIDPDNK